MEVPPYFEDNYGHSHTGYTQDLDYVNPGSFEEAPPYVEGGISPQLAVVTGEVIEQPDWVNMDPMTLPAVPPYDSGGFSGAPHFNMPAYQQPPQYVDYDHQIPPYPMYNEPVPNQKQNPQNLPTVPGYTPPPPGYANPAPPPYSEPQPPPYNMNQSTPVDAKPPPPAYNYQEHGSTIKPGVPAQTSPSPTGSAIKNTNVPPNSTPAALKVQNVPRSSSVPPREVKLPTGWIKAVDKKGRTFYADHFTKATRWSPPDPLPEGWERKKEKSGKERIYYMDHFTKTTQWNPPPPLPPNFERKKDKHGRVFYLDHQNRTTHWTLPKDKPGTSAAAAPASIVPSNAPLPSVPQQKQVTMNGITMTPDAIATLERTINNQVQSGNYWYDKRCGGWGVWGGPCLGFLKAGLDIGGPLPLGASNGNSGIIINNRELAESDWVVLQQMGMEVVPGRWWLNEDGSYGHEGNNIAVGKIDISSIRV